MVELYVLPDLCLSLIVLVEVLAPLHVSVVEVGGLVLRSQVDALFLLLLVTFLQWHVMVELLVRFAVRVR